MFLKGQQLYIMDNKKEFELNHSIGQPTVINTLRIMKDNFGMPPLLILKKKIKTFSILIADKTLKEAFDEYFKNEL